MIEQCIIKRTREAFSAASDIEHSTAVDIIEIVRLVGGDLLLTIDEVAVEHCQRPNRLVPIVFEHYLFLLEERTDVSADILRLIRCEDKRLRDEILEIQFAQSDRVVVK